jgi:hypothetical protein
VFEKELKEEVSVCIETPTHADIYSETTLPWRVPDKLDEHTAAIAPLSPHIGGRTCGEPSPLAFDEITLSPTSHSEQSRFLVTGLGHSTLLIKCFLLKKPLHVTKED